MSLPFVSFNEAELAADVAALGLSIDDALAQGIISEYEHDMLRIEAERSYWVAREKAFYAAHPEFLQAAPQPFDGVMLHRPSKKERRKDEDGWD